MRGFFARLRACPIKSLRSLCVVAAKAEIQVLRRFLDPGFRRADAMESLIRRSLRVVVFLVAVLLVQGSVFGVEAATTGGDSMAAVVELLKRKGVISAEEAAELRQKSGTAPSSEKEMKAILALLQSKGVLSAEEVAQVTQEQMEPVPPPRPGTGQVITIIPQEREAEYVQQITKNVVKEVKKDVQAQVKAELEEERSQALKPLPGSGAMPEWVQRIRWGGDMRLRYQGDIYDKNNADLLKPDEPTELMNTKNNQNRFLVRARLKLEAQVSDEVRATVRVAGGKQTNPVSTNDLLGDYYDKKGLWLDQAYLRWQPVRELTFTGGRVPNPWFYSNLVWDDDLNFDGVAANYTGKVSETFSGFLTAAAFPLQNVEVSSKSKWLFAAQGGVEYKPVPEVRSKLGVAYYDYENTVGVANDPSYPNQNDWTAPLFQQKGNTLFDIDPSSDLKLALASAYKELDVIGSLDIAIWRPIHVVLMADYVRNLGFKRKDVAQRTGLDESEIKDWVNGFQGGLLVGYPKPRKFAQWNASLYYRYLEPDAVLDAFTDSDFHGGGTNCKGWILGVEFGLAKNLWLGCRWLTSDEVTGPALAIDTIQADINAEF